MVLSDEQIGGMIPTRCHPSYLHIFLSYLMVAVPVIILWSDACLSETFPLTILRTFS